MKAWRDCEWAEGRGGCLALMLLCAGCVLALSLDWSNCPAAPLNVWLLTVLVVLSLDVCLYEWYRDPVAPGSQRSRESVRHVPQPGLDMRDITVVGAASAQQDEYDDASSQGSASSAPSSALYDLARRVAIVSPAVPHWAFVVLLVSQLFLGVWCIYGATLYAKSGEQGAACSAGLLRNYSLFVMICGCVCYFFTLCYNVTVCCVEATEGGVVPAAAAARERRYTCNSTDEGVAPPTRVSKTAQMA